MNREELFKILSPSQQKEFNDDVESTVRKMIDTNNIHENKLHEISTNINLENQIFLNVTIYLVVNEQGGITGKINNIKKFDSIDEYLDSINESNSKNEDWLKLK